MSTSSFHTKVRSQILLKFVYSEKATNFCEISTLLLFTVHTDKSKVEISQNSVAFSEYMIFTCVKNTLTFRRQRYPVIFGQTIEVSGHSGAYSFFLSAEEKVCRIYVRTLCYVCTYILCKYIICRVLALLIQVLKIR